MDIAGMIAVRHGTACAESQNPAEEQIVELDGSVNDLPSWVTRATVILNGWSTSYIKTDRYVAGFGTIIKDVSFQNGVLSWKAAGGMSDENFDDPYRWCYWYTVAGWNDTVIDAQPFELPAISSPCDTSSGQFRHPDSGYSGFREHVENTPFSGNDGVAVVPRGFGFFRVAAEVLQVAYDLEHSEALVWRGPTSATTSPSVYDSGHESWRTEAIFKDNDGSKGFWGGESTALVGGKGVVLVQPPFDVIPATGPGHAGCIDSGRQGIQQEDYEFRNLPFSYALPMLSGWDLSYQCGDQYVLRMGAWIDDFEYNRGAGALTTHVSSMLGDLSTDSFNTRIKLSVLGLFTRLPDLVVVEPDPAAHFCRTDARGLFVVSVQNKGGGMAIPSTTKLQYGSGTRWLTTPKLAPGEIVDLFTDPLPPACLSPGCPLKITADANNVVVESDESNNVVSGACP